MRALQPGDRVKLTGVFLKNSGQVKGGEGRKVWTVTTCDCGLCAKGGYIAVDERSSFALPGEPPNRHINAANVYRVGTMDARNAG